MSATDSDSTPDNAAHGGCPGVPCSGFFWERYAITKDRREWTRLRIIAAERAVKREADAMALCPELRRFSTVAERQKQIDHRAEYMTAALRLGRAKTWRKVRKDFRALPPEVRQRILAKWQTRYMPGDPAAFSSTMLMQAGEPYASQLRQKWIAEMRAEYSQNSVDQRTPR
jgi:hypothetical protein